MLLEQPVLAGDRLRRKGFWSVWVHLIDKPLSFGVVPEDVGFDVRTRQNLQR